MLRNRHIRHIHYRNYYGRAVDLHYSEEAETHLDLNRIGDAY